MDEASRWTELEHLAMTACLGERDVAEAVGEFCARVTALWGTPCRFVAGIQAKAESHEQSFRVGRPEDGGAATLIVGTEPPLSSATADRLVRLLQLMGYAADPFPKSQKIIHRLRNLLAGVLTNIEFVEMVISEGPGGEGPRISLDQRTQLLAALAHARRSGRELVELVRELATVDPTNT